MKKICGYTFNYDGFVLRFESDSFIIVIDKNTRDYINLYISDFDSYESFAMVRNMLEKDNHIQ